MQKWEQKDDMAEPDEWEPDLFQVLDRKELTLHFLPLVDLQTGKLIGAEALLRRYHLEKGILLPRTFIPQAEKSGAIIPIEKWVLLTACKQNKQWQEWGFEPFLVSVNISALSFFHMDFVKTVESVLIETGLTPRYLELELTEALTMDAERTLSIMLQLKRIGVQICMDDFGMGYSSLHQLRLFPIDRLKIDQTFVRNCQIDQTNAAIVKMIIGMAVNMQVQVTAEGVETKEQLRFLQHNQCDSAQGHLFCEAVPATKLIEKLAWSEEVLLDWDGAQIENAPSFGRAASPVTQLELSDALRKQQGMTFSFQKQGDKFIHTLCVGELLYKIGLTPEDVIGKPLIEILPESEAVRKERYYERAWNGEDNVNYEGFVNGVHYLAALRPIYDSGQVKEVIASCVDITELKKAEEEKRISEAKYRLIAENMSDVIIILDSQFMISYVSPSVDQVMGVSPEALLHLPIVSFIPKDQEERLKETLQEIIATKLPRLITFSWIQQNGNKIILEAKGTPVMKDCGAGGQIIFVIRNVTAQLQAEEFLRKMEKLSVVGQLAAGVAHEIRNPVTSIKGFVQLLRRDQGKKEYFDIMLAEFQQLESILREFVFLTQQHSNHYELTDVGSMLRNITSAFQAETVIHELELTLFQLDELRMWCDPDQIKQVIGHLLSNAMESMDEGGVIHILARPEGHDKVMIRIADKGCGMSEERLKRLGEPFYSTKEKGIGLGLMISYKMIENHEGYLHFSSEPNKGTTVEVYLPINQVRSK
ncbi:EAL domain-containing protein [Brevibacillus sp. NRS-1366]|uniref:EAL domain-containing protein n=1 Tax=Brevibacillus sp. NRS-1366 TaxID=3233899 RepID=UPI003D221907